MEVNICKITNFRGWRCRAASGRYGIVPKGCGVCLRVNIGRKCVFLWCVRVIFGLIWRILLKFGGWGAISRGSGGRNLVKISDLGGWRCRAASGRYGIVPKGFGMCLRVKVRRKHIFCGVCASCSVKVGWMC